MPERVLAVAAHPDDIEFMMSGTLMLLGEAGFELHCLTIGNGSCGSAVLPAAEIVRIRATEARAAAAAMGARYHESLVNDIDIFYEKELLARVAAIVRAVAPRILLVQSPVDYMEDHQISARLAVTAAFCRGMPNYPTLPPMPAVQNELCVYHAQPHGNRDPLRNRIVPHLFVDVTAVMARKRNVLACHQSQKTWLDESQGMNSYLLAMEETDREVGSMSGRFAFAEGWRRRLHLGFCAPEDDPLRRALPGHTRAANGRN